MSLHLRIAAAAVAAALCLATPAATAANTAVQPTGARAQVPRIADQRTVDIRLGQPSSTAIGASRAAIPNFDISTADASFVKVHFDYFNLPSGVTLEVSSPDGREVYRYRKDKRDGFTVDPNLGQDGNRSFSSMSISGPSARLRLVGTATERWTSAHGVVVTRYMEGYPDAMLKGLLTDGLLTETNSTKALCGADDKQAAACYSSSDPTVFDRTRPVGKLILGSGGSCTSWRVSSDNRMFTNNHCFASTSEVAASEVWFNYQLTTCGGGTTGALTKVPGDTLLKTDTTYDYSLFTVKNFSTISSFGYFGLDVRTPTTGEEIFIPQHAGGRLKELGVVSDQNGGGRCKIDAATTNGNGTNTDSGYYCDTEPGSSGSPVVARSSNKVIALHHLGGCLNTGAQITQIWPQVSSFFSGIPSGDNGGNAPPIANFSFTTSGLVANFSDGSSDANGTITQRAWTFGDGGTSTATNPSHTYATAGTYSVQLTVTDNGGTTASTTKSVTVSVIAPPVANFSFSSSGFTASFTDASSGGNGGIVSRNWNFGDSTTSTATSPSHTYAALGTYSVSLTVTDGAGATNTKVQSVAITQPNNVLSNGVAKTGLAAATGASLNFTMVVPAGATGLKFVMTGGTGDADLYVKFGSAPTTSVYDCRPYLSGNAETCNIATAQAGTYYVMLRGYAAFSGVSLTGSYTTGTPPGPSFTNNTPMTINDNTTIVSSITVSGVTGAAPATLKVPVNITHTYQGDLKVDLIAPNGTTFNLWNRTGGGTDNINQTFTVNASSVAAPNGVWKLQVADQAAGDTGTLNSWGLQF